jgi:hypothetical protein
LNESIEAGDTREIGLTGSGSAGPDRRHHTCANRVARRALEERVEDRRRKTVGFRY